MNDGPSRNLAFLLVVSIEGAEAYFSTEPLNILA